VAEVQVLPSLIPSLKWVGGDTGATPLEFGTVIVYTCFKSCWEEGKTGRGLYKNELVYVQAETI
jgi:hypothetical protein